MLGSYVQEAKRGISIAKGQWVGIGTTLGIIQLGSVSLEPIRLRGCAHVIDSIQGSTITTRPSQRPVRLTSPTEFRIPPITRGTILLPYSYPELSATSTGPVETKSPQPVETELSHGSRTSLE